jgi:hypothetical protein
MMKFITCIPHLNIVRVIKSRMMRWTGHVALMGRGGVFIGFWLGSPKGRDNQGMWGRITLRQSFGK